MLFVIATLHADPSDRGVLPAVTRPCTQTMKVGAP